MAFAEIALLYASAVSVCVCVEGFFPVGCVYV